MHCESGQEQLTQPSAKFVKLTCCFLASGTMLKYLAAKVSSQPVMSVGIAVGRDTSSQLCTSKPAASSRLCAVAADEKFQGLPALWSRPCCASTAANATRTCRARCYISRMPVNERVTAHLQSLSVSLSPLFQSRRPHRYYIASATTVHNEASTRQ